MAVPAGTAPRVASEGPSDVSYFERAHVLKREYDQSTLDAEFDESEPYSALQLDGFDLLNREGQLFVWTTEEELRGANLP